MHVLAFRHSPHEDLGWLADVLADHGISYQYIDTDSKPNLRGAGAFIFLGGSMSANDNLPFLHRELQYIQEAIHRRLPVLGICLGAQMIAKALGAAVHQNAVSEIGWFPVTFTEAAGRDPLFAGLDSSPVLFHWHRETFQLPENAELLAYSASCAHQAFRFGDRIYGMQFHLEVTPAMIAQWLRDDAACGEAREASQSADAEPHAAHAEALARQVFGRWCRLVLG